MTTEHFCFYLHRLIQASQTGGQWYSDTSPFSIPCEIWTLPVNYESVMFYSTGPGALKRANNWKSQKTKKKCAKKFSIFSWRFVLQQVPTSFNQKGEGVGLLMLFLFLLSW
jgi:hypothetical protein